MAIPTVITGTGETRQPSGYRLRVYPTLIDLVADTNAVIIRQGDAGESSTSGVLALTGVSWGSMGACRGGTVRLAGGVEVNETKNPFVTIDFITNSAWRRVWAGRVQRASREWFRTPTPDGWRASVTMLQLLGLHSLYQDDTIPANAILSWSGGLNNTRLMMTTTTQVVSPGETYSTHWQKQLDASLIAGGEYGTGPDLYNVAGTPAGGTPLVIDDPDSYLGLTESGREFGDYSTSYVSAQGNGWQVLTGLRASIPDYVPRKVTTATIANPFIEQVVNPWVADTTFSDPFNVFTNLTGWGVSKVYGWDGSTPLKVDGRSAETVSAIWRGRIVVQNLVPGYNHVAAYTDTNGFYHAEVTQSLYATFAVRGFRGDGSGGWIVFANGDPLQKIDTNGTYNISLEMPASYVSGGGNWRVIVEILTPQLPTGSPISVGSFDYTLYTNQANWQAEYRRKDLNTTPDNVPGFKADLLIGPTFTFKKVGAWIPPLQIKSLPPALGAGPITQYAGTASLDWPSGGRPVTTIETAFMPRRSPVVIAGNYTRRG